MLSFTIKIYWLSVFRKAIICYIEFEPVEFKKFLCIFGKLKTEFEKLEYFKLKINNV